MKAPKGYILIKAEEYWRLLLKIDELHEQVKELRRMLRKDSKNSHQPPSSDGYKKEIKNNREKSNKCQGAQKGHKGQALEMVEHPDEVIYHKVSGKCSCGKDVSSIPVWKVHRRQEFDIPKKIIRVTEHQVEVRRCDCGSIHEAISPIQNHVEYGKRLKAISTYLNQYQHIPYGRLQEMFEDCFSRKISDGLLEQSNRECYTYLAPTEEEIKEVIKSSEVIHNDETGLRCEGKLQWVHSCSTPTHTHYSIQLKRGKEGIDKVGILTDYKGISVHDRWSSYEQYSCSHALCNAHLLRELKYIYEEMGRAWAGEMIGLLVEANNKKKDDELTVKIVQEMEQRYEQIINEALLKEPPEPIVKKKKRGRKAKNKSLRLIETFRDKRENILRFLHNKEVPFDNNLAERDIRMVKLKQKISGCFRTSQGAEVFCRIRSYISTVKKQGINVLDALEVALNGQPVSFLN